MKNKRDAIRPHREMQHRKPSQYLNGDHGQTSSNLDRGHERFNCDAPKAHPGFLNGAKK